jgi:type IV pilus assembly protein PilE
MDVNPGGSCDNEGNSMRKQLGVTLVELLTVVTVVAILGSIAIPGYLTYTRKARRADAKVALTSTAQQLERCYTRYYSYVQTANGGKCPLTLPYNSQNNAYTIDADPAAVPTPGITAASFALKATPIGDQVKDTHCGTFRLNQNNVRDVSTGATDCW